MLHCAAVMPTGLPHCASVTTTAAGTKISFDVLQTNGVEKSEIEVEVNKPAHPASSLRKRSAKETGNGNDNDSDNGGKSPKRRNLSETEVDNNAAKTDWEFEAFEQDDALDMGAMLPPASDDNGNENDNRWILRDNNNDNDGGGFMMNHETEYFQLQVPGYNNNNQGGDAGDTPLFPLPDIAMAPELDLDLTPSLANFTPADVQVNTSTGAITPSSGKPPAQPGVVASSNKGLPKAEIAPVAPFQWTTENSYHAAAAQDLFCNVSAPQIETRIVAPPQTTPRASPIRILPRESKQSTAQSLTSSHPKRSRPGPSRSPGTPSFTLGPTASPTVPTASPAVPTGNTGTFALDPQQLNASRSGSIAGHPPAAAPAPVPHPMAGPMLFAQGFSPLPNHTPGVRNASSAQSPHSPFVFVPPPHQKQPITTTSQSVGSDSQAAQKQNPMVYQPSVSPNAFLPTQPVDPNTLMRMAQQMWYAAMAASGNPILPQSVPCPNRPPFFANPAFLNPAMRALAVQPGVPMGNTATTATQGPASPPNRDGTPPIPMMNMGHGKARPVFITDDGKHVVVEQQAPAKLMKHPVLGRLQLATKQQQALEQETRILNQSPVAPPPVAQPTSDNKPPPAPPPANPTAASSPSPGGSKGKDRRKRLVWTPELHDRFVQAIGAVGIHQAVPKTLVQIMNVEGLTTEHVKSHLQKYRNQLRKNSSDDNREREAQTDSGALMIIERMEKGGEVRVLPNRNATTVATDVRMLVKAQPTITALPAENEAKGEIEQMLPAKDGVFQSESGPSAAGGATPVTSTDDIEGLQRVRMQKRTMDLQYQLQVMVYRTVALQKQLQVSIEKENRPKRPHVVTATSEAAPEKEAANLESEIQELDRQKEKVMAELGKLQEQFGNEKKENK